MNLSLLEANIPSLSDDFPAFPFGWVCHFPGGWWFTSHASGMCSNSIPLFLWDELIYMPMLCWSIGVDIQRPTLLRTSAICIPFRQVLTYPSLFWATESRPFLGVWNQNQPPNTLLKTNIAPEKTKGNNRLPTKGKLVTFQGGYIHQKTHVYVFFGGSFWGGWEPCLCLGPVSVVVSPPRELTTSRAASPG